jgi:hypothetical protein
VWEYCDPDLTGDDAPVALKKPAPPEAGAENFSHLMDLHKLKVHEVEKAKMHLMQVDQLINSTIAPEILQRLADADTVYQKMVALQKEFGPGVGGRTRHEIIDAWVSVNQPVQKGEKIDAWVKRWRAVYDEAVHFKFECATPKLAVGWFLRAIQHYDPLWYAL